MKSSEQEAFEDERITDLTSSGVAGWKDESSEGGEGGCE